MRFNKINLLIMSSIAFALMTFIVMAKNYHLRQELRSMNKKTYMAKKDRIKPTETPNTSQEKGSEEYYRKELQLVTDQLYNNQQTSYLFGIRIRPFHADWECDSSQMTEKGFKVSCSQTPCSSAPFKLGVKPSECSEDLTKREYPPSFSQLQISATTQAVATNETKLQETIATFTNSKTPKNIAYNFQMKPGKEKYQNHYSITFYSPFFLSNIHSNLQGTYFGSDTKIGKYTIQIDVTGDDVDEKKVRGLAEKIIDNVQFIRPATQ